MTPPPSMQDHDLLIEIHTIVKGWDDRMNEVKDRIEEVKTGKTENCATQRGRIDKVEANCQWLWASIGAILVIIGLLKIFT